MDQAKIGKFISDMRKKQGLTQKQLADQLNVTDKTVSKWETGYRLPDASLLLELSSALEVDINELLAGEEFLPKELPPEEYARKTESNIVGLVSELNEIDKRSRSRSIATITGISLSGLALLIPFASSLQAGSMVDMIVLRAVINRPPLLLCDEPTGSLNSAQSVIVMDLLNELNRNGQTIVLVTHDVKVAVRGRRGFCIR